MPSEGKLLKEQPRCPLERQVVFWIEDGESRSRTKLKIGDFNVPFKDKLHFDSIGLMI